MKKNILLTLIIALCFPLGAFAGEIINGMVFTEATDFTVVGKLFPDTPNPYHRLDTVVWKGLNAKENLLTREASGIAIAFKTNSHKINILTEYGYRSFSTNITGISARGYDLYIKKDGKWLWASSGVCHDNKADEPFNLMNDLDGSMHECLLYLPTFSEVYSALVFVNSWS